MRAFASLVLVASIACSQQPGAEPAPPQPVRPGAVNPANVKVTFKQLSAGLVRPTAITDPKDGTSRVFIVEQAGRVRIWTSGGGLRSRAFLDIRGRVLSYADSGGGNEQGLLGLAFHPKFTSNGKFYVSYTDQQGDLVVARYKVNPPTANRATHSSHRKIIDINHPGHPAHNGGQLHFDDTYLFISTGDGGGAGDPGNDAQDKGSLLGKILRINVNKQCGSKRYCSPGTNPFHGSTPGRGEILHYGLRNPWRWSFDRANGTMIIGDVGEQAREEVSAAGRNARGVNFGWDCREGTVNVADVYGGGYCSGRTFKAPRWDYNQTDNGRCAIIGGYVYRGSRFPVMRGVYVYADFCSDEVWGLARSDGAWKNAQVATAPDSITTFGQRPNGDILAATMSLATGAGRLFLVKGRAR
ncbi:MAG TPA: PQQ-dependent sugar dehydrogenase [Actinomycetota bacterium]